MVRIITRITSAPPIATRIKKPVKGLLVADELDPLPIGEAVVLCCAEEAVAPSCVEVVLDARDAPVEVDIGKLE